LRDKIHGHSPDGWRQRYDAVGTEEVLTPEDQRALDSAINVFDPTTPARPGGARLDAERAEAARGHRRC